jgi:urease accessory protein UreF
MLLTESNVSQSCDAVALWESTYRPAGRQHPIPVEDRLPLGIGIGTVIAQLDTERRDGLFTHLMSQSLERLDRLVAVMRGMPTGSSDVTSLLSRISNEIRIISTLSRSFNDALSSQTMMSGLTTSTDKHDKMGESTLSVLRRAWPAIVAVSTDFAGDEVSAFSSFVNVSNERFSDTSCCIRTFLSLWLPCSKLCFHLK